MHWLFQTRLHVWKQICSSHLDSFDKNTREISNKLYSSNDYIFILDFSNSKDMYLFFWIFDINIYLWALSMSLTLAWIAFLMIGNIFCDTLFYNLLCSVRLKILQKRKIKKKLEKKRTVLGLSHLIRNKCTLSTPCLLI